MADYRKNTIYRQKLTKEIKNTQMTQTTNAQDKTTNEQNKNKMLGKSVQSTKPKDLN